MGSIPIARSITFNNPLRRKGLFFLSVARANGFNLFAEFSSPDACDERGGRRKGAWGGGPRGALAGREEWCGDTTVVWVKRCRPMQGRRVRPLTVMSKSCLRIWRTCRTSWDLFAKLSKSSWVKTCEVCRMPCRTFYTVPNKIPISITHYPIRCQRACLPRSRPAVD